mgnify:CR=1 FL=1
MLLRAKRAAVKVINERGVALYNAGDMAGCAQVYANTIVDILSDLSTSSSSSTTTTSANATCNQQARILLTNGLQKATSCGTNVDAQAWALRDTLDQLINLNPFTTTTSILFSDHQSLATFRIIDDDVMGGRSKSSMDYNKAQSCASFAGTLSTANNGGFASCRGSVTWNLEHCTFLRITAAAAAVAAPKSGACGGGGGNDGGVALYKLRLQDTERMDGVSHQHDFHVVGDGEWHTYDLPLESFVATWRGRIQEKCEPLNRKSVMSVGVMISKLTDKGERNESFRAGEFELLLRSIEGL